MDPLDEQVQFAIGRASMCWSEIPTGVYNDQMASQIAAELIEAIHKRLALEREKYEKESSKEAPQAM
jgi:hypothetical protein